MDALEYRIMKALRAIAEKAYPRHKIPGFEVVISDEPLKTRLGDWTAHPDGQPIARIRLFWMQRDDRYIILTAIHELAHHCDHMLHGKTGHAKPFYICHAELLSAACRMSIFTRDMLEKLYAGDSDGSGDMKLVAYMRRIESEGLLSFEPVPEETYMAGMSLISVYNAYDIRDILKEHHFRYNKRSHGWELQANEEDTAYWTKILTETECFPVVTGVLDTVLDADITVSGNTYEVRDVFKQMGYRYKDREWHKRIRLSEWVGEKEKLDSLIGTCRKKIKYKINY